MLDDLARFDGITPAWAGKSRLFRMLLDCLRDHPRMGGEKYAFYHLLCLASGSPPHGRGKGSPVCLTGSRSGITPAWAGKSTLQTSTTRTAGDHPRMGGEKSYFVCTIDTPIGSPPHGRGKGGYGWLMLTLTGITPAWAGKRLKRSHRSGIFISGPIPFHSALHRPAGSGGSRAGRDGSPAGQPQNAGPA